MTNTLRVQVLFEEDEVCLLLGFPQPFRELKAIVRLNTFNPDPFAPKPAEDMLSKDPGRISVSLFKSLQISQAAVL